MPIQRALPYPPGKPVAGCDLDHAAVAVRVVVGVVWAGYAPVFHLAEPWHGRACDRIGVSTSISGTNPSSTFQAPVLQSHGLRSCALQISVNPLTTNQLYRLAPTHTHTHTTQKEQCPHISRSWGAASPVLSRGQGPLRSHSCHHILTAICKSCERCSKKMRATACNVPITSRQIFQPVLLPFTSS